MSQELRKDQNVERDINRMNFIDGERKNYESFEGMNYEQIRQPFNSKYTGRIRSIDKRNKGKRPDEG
jgi:hypothetical protein